jgi:hypothetical protein
LGSVQTCWCIRHRPFPGLGAAATTITTPHACHPAPLAVSNPQCPAVPLHLHGVVLHCVSCCTNQEPLGSHRARGLLESGSAVDPVHLP